MVAGGFDLPIEVSDDDCRTNINITECAELACL
jgi:hypothetical protein